MSKYQKLYFKRAVKVANLLQLVPYVRAVFLTGSVARGEAKKSSDIDFFIVTTSGRIWTCRALVTILVQIIGLRRHGKKIAGRICLNRYQTDDNLEIKPHNSYHKNDYSQTITLVDLNNIEEKYRAVNKWIKTFNNVIAIRPRAEKQSLNDRLPRRLRLLAMTAEKILNTRIGDWIEKKLKKYQQKRILNDPRTKLAPRGKIIANDKALCFHPTKSNILRASTSESRSLYRVK